MEMPELESIPFETENVISTSGECGTFSCVPDDPNHSCPVFCDIVQYG